MSPAKRRLALAADLPLKEAIAIYGKVSSHVGIVKVGLSLFVEHGPAAVEAFVSRGAQVFLDLKLHDIPNTVGLAAAQAARLGVRLLTVHASGGEAMVRAAVRGAREGAESKKLPPPIVLAVTVLTSISEKDLKSHGLSTSAAEHVERLALSAYEAGADGVVCSALEVKRLRELLGEDAFLCTPGIRMAGASVDDQVRTQGPAEAIRDGSTLLVVGRPIYAAPDPLKAATEYAEAIESAF